MKATRIAGTHGREPPPVRARDQIGGTCPYDQTAALHAVAAQFLLTESPQRTGFASGCQAFGHRTLLDALVEADLVCPPLVTVDG